MLSVSKSICLKEQLHLHISYFSKPKNSLSTLFQYLSLISLITNSSYQTLPFIIPSISIELISPKHCQITKSKKFPLNTNIQIFYTISPKLQISSLKQRKRTKHPTSWLWLLRRTHFSNLLVWQTWKFNINIILVNLMITSTNLILKCLNSIRWWNSMRRKLSYNEWVSNKSFQFHIVWFDWYLNLYPLVPFDFLWHYLWLCS